MKSQQKKQFLSNVIESGKIKDFCKILQFSIRIIQYNNHIERDTVSVNDGIHSVQNKPY
jgi:hypothetical protein